MHDELSNQVELAPDLEWLLLNDQTNANDLLVHLVDDYGAELSLLVQTMFADLSTAEDALVETLAQIMLQRSRYRSDQPLEVWIYSLALDSAWRMRRKWGKSQKEPRVVVHSASESLMQQNTLPAWLEYLPEQPRLVVVMERFLSLEIRVIAQILEVSSSSAASDLAIVNKVFPSKEVEHKPALGVEQHQRLVQLALSRLSMRQPHRRLSRTFLEMSWAVGAVILVAMLTWFNDLRNPDPVRQAVEFTLLTPSVKTTREPLPTATFLPLLNGESTSDEIAVRLWQRMLRLDSIWEDSLVLLGGAQGGPTGHTVKRVEFAWDTRSRKMMFLVGPPDGPPENGLFTDGSNYYELAIRNGKLTDVSALDLTRPNAWYYLATLPYNLQINNFEGNVSYRALGTARAAGRDALLVMAINSDGIPEVYTWLDLATALPLRQQRFAEQLWERTSLVLDVIVNQILIDEPFPRDYFSLEISRRIEFHNQQARWWNDGQIEASLRKMEQDLAYGNAGDLNSNSQNPLYYQVKEITNQGEGIKYSVAVFAGREFLGEYPMGNPWSVLCERSSDGRKVAFIEDRRFEFGSRGPSQLLHWFSLDNPGELHTLLPGSDATLFKFSPDSLSLAVHASNEVSLINLVSGKIEPLMVLPSVDRLAFSQDGKYLGILRNLLQEGGATDIWIIDLGTKQLVESLQYGPNQDWISQRAEIAKTREVDFTGPVYFGLENCR